MGEGHPRRTRRAARYDTRDVAVLSKKPNPNETDWDERVAAGTRELPISELVSRTTTVDDPLTTSLLAEITRQSTIDASPDAPLDDDDQADDTDQDEGDDEDELAISTQANERR